MEPIVIIIPVNYTEAGKILGLFEFRNFIEAIILCTPLLFLTLFCLPFSITVNIIVTSILVIPVGGFAVIGVNDYSLITFLRIYLKWKKERKKYTIINVCEVS